MSNETVAALPCWACADEAKGKPRCEQWCCLPGKCISTYPESTWPQFIEIKFDGRNIVDNLVSSGGLKDFMRAHSIPCLRSYDGTVSLERRYVPHLMRALEGVLVALAPHIPPSASGVSPSDAKTQEQQP